MIEDLAGRLAGLQRAMAAPLPSPEELAAGQAQDRVMAERIHKARPGVPVHHAYAVLEALRTLQRVDAAKVEPESDLELTREDAVEAMQEIAQDLHTAQDRLAFVREMCDLADREQRQVTTEQVRAWTHYTGCANATPDGASLARSLGFAMAAMQPGAEPVFCHHEHRTVRWRTVGGVTTSTATCTACPARAESTEGEPSLTPYLLNAARCTDACTEQHTYRDGCLMAPDFSRRP